MNNDQGTQKRVKINLKNLGKIKLRTRSEDDRSSKEAESATKIPETEAPMLAKEEEPKEEEHGATRKLIKSKISLALNKNTSRGLRTSQKRLLTKFQMKRQDKHQDTFEGEQFQTKTSILEDTATEKVKVNFTPKFKEEKKGTAAIVNDQRSPVPKIGQNQVGINL